MKRITCESGLTLIEITVTIGVVAFTMLAVLFANTQIQKMTEAAFERSVALQDANQVLEQMRNTARIGTFPTNVTTAFPNNGNIAGFNSLAGQQIVVTYVNPAVDPLDTTVTVSWQENGIRPVNTALRTLVTRRV